MGSMISVVATVVFLVLLLHAFIVSKPVQTSGYYTKQIIIPKALVEKRGFKLTKLFSLMTLLSSDTMLGMPMPNQFGFQMPATPIMEGIIDLHHDIMFFLVFISIFVLYLLVAVIILFSDSETGLRNTSTVSHHTILEII
jgi:hypothetical protein